MRVVLFAADANENSLGRVYVLWMLARHLGWEVTTVAHRGERVWEPLANTEFAQSILLRKGPQNVRDLVREAVEQSDLLIGCKPRPESSGAALRWARRSNKPVVIDIDDPDFEFQFESPLRRRVRSWLTRPIRRIGYIRLQRTIGNYPILVSNEVLRGRYGGWIVPHARQVRDTTEPIRTTKSPLEIAFVGTVHPHKGVHLLREAVRKVSAEVPLELTVTDVAPADATANERWVGKVPFQTGIDLVASCDIVVIPSLDRGWGRAQLPAKLMDAMIAGRPIIVSDIAPLKWAVADSALVVRENDADAIAEALLAFNDPEVRADYGRRARNRANEVFSIGAVSVSFEIACRTATRLYKTREVTADV